MWRVQLQKNTRPQSKPKKRSLRKRKMEYVNIKKLISYGAGKFKNKKL